MAAQRIAPAVACGALLTFNSQAARADDSGLYAGANFGDTLATFRRADLGNAVTATFAASGDTVGLSDTSARNAHLPWSVDVGYRFSGNFSLEASYIELATLEYAARGTETSAFGSSPLSLGLNIKSHGPALAFVGVLPMTNDWSLEAQLGGYEGKTITQYVVTAGGTNRGSDSKTSASLLGSIGLDYVIAAHWVLRLDYTHLNQLGEKETGKSFNVDLLTGGVIYAF